MARLPTRNPKKPKVQTKLTVSMATPVFLEKIYNKQLEQKKVFLIIKKLHIGIKLDKLTWANIHRRKKGIYACKGKVE